MMILTINIELEEDIEEEIEEGGIDIQGNTGLVKAFFESLESFITTPLAEPK